MRGLSGGEYHGIPSPKRWHIICVPVKHIISVGMSPIFLDPKTHGSCFLFVPGHVSGLGHVAGARSTRSSGARYWSCRRKCSIPSWCPSGHWRRFRVTWYTPTRCRGGYESILCCRIWSFFTPSFHQLNANLPEKSLVSSIHSSIIKPASLKNRWFLPAQWGIEDRVPGLDAAELRVLRAAHPWPRPAAGGEAVEAHRTRRRVGGPGGPGSLVGPWWVTRCWSTSKQWKVGVPSFSEKPHRGEGSGSYLECFDNLWMNSNFLMEFWIYIVLGCDMLTAGFARVVRRRLIAKTFSLLQNRGFTGNEILTWR